MQLLFGLLLAHGWFVYAVWSCHTQTHSSRFCCLYHIFVRQRALYCNCAHVFPGYVRHDELYSTKIQTRNRRICFVFFFLILRRLYYVLRSVSCINPYRMLILSGYFIISSNTTIVWLSEHTTMACTNFMLRNFYIGSNHHISPTMCTYWYALEQLLGSTVVYQQIEIKKKQNKTNTPKQKFSFKILYEMEWTPYLVLIDPHRQAKKSIQMHLYGITTGIFLHTDIFFPYVPQVIVDIWVRHTFAYDQSSI